MGDHLMSMVAWWAMMIVIMTSAATSAAAAGSSLTVNVGRFGAKADGKSDSTKAFLRAWSMACGSTASTVTIYVPWGRFLLKSVLFEGPCKSRRIVFQVDGTLVAPSDYRVIGSSGSWISFHQVARMSLRGATLDARGHSYWACRASKSNCPSGARSIAFSWWNNIVVNKLTTLNSQRKHITIDNSNNILFKRLTIRAPSSSPNTDGIHVQSSSGITVSGASIGTGDDCISLGPGSRNVWIEHIRCGPGHGISIGSLGEYADEKGVHNVTVTGSVFAKTQNGVRIKSWDKRSNGFAANIRFQNLIMKNVNNPIIIDQKYCPGGSACPHQGSNVKISQVTYQNIVGSLATKVGVNLYCSPSQPCRGIRLRNINLTFHKTPTISVCANARGTATGFLIPRSCLSK